LINPKLVIGFPEELAAYWRNTNIADLFEASNLVLRLRDGDYSRRVVGDGLQVKDGFTSFYGLAAIKKSGFQVKIRDTREDLWLALKELAEWSVNDGFTIRPLTVQDYCIRENRADRDRGYRLRVGYIPGDSLDDVSGSATEGYVNCETKQEFISQPVVRYGSGFSFKFMEVENTGYY
jgi:hypothetical protein